MTASRIYVEVVSRVLKVEIGTYLQLQARS